MPEKPSWTSSTLSQLAVACVSAYLLGALWVSFKTGDITSLKWAAEVFGASYLATRGMKGANGSEATPTPGGTNGQGG